MLRTEKNILTGSIPAGLQPYFQEYDFSRLDLDEHANLIIQRTLEFGEWDDLCWLFATYGRRRIRLFLREHGERWLRPPVFNYCRKLLHIRKWNKSPFPIAKGELWPY